VRALRGVDLRVRPGAICGLLGPNGAGKTTLLKILSCLVLPDRGVALIAGDSTRHERRVKARIGLVHSDERSFYWRLSARENLRFFARLYDVPGRRIGARIEHLLERVGMHDVADRPFSGYSSGMKQRIAIARALLHDPPILLMDEPTRSLDPAAALSVRALVRDELNRRDGKTILLATHNLHEAEALSDRLAILSRGQVLEEGTAGEIRLRGSEERRFALEVELEAVLPPGPFRVVTEEAGTGRRRLLVALDDGAGLEALLRPLVQAGVRLHACDRVEPDLEEVFARIVGSDRERA
jgi:ABC-2 type transport system ATP-binding protein